MDEQVKATLTELARAINDGLGHSRGISASVRKLKSLGYNLSLYLEATVLLTRSEEDASARRKTRRVRSGSLRLNDTDVKFLRSLKISLAEKNAKS